MKTANLLSLSVLLLSALVCRGALAGLLCATTTCDLEIDFYDGGSIEAVEPLTIEFGDGGLVNDGVVTTAYVAGDNLALASGERLEFAPGGQFRLGSGGNIDMSRANFIVGGDAVLGATGNGEVNLPAGSSLTLQNGGELTLGSDLVVAGTLDLSNGTLQTLNEPTIIRASGGLIEAGINTLSISNATPVSAGAISLTALTIDDLVSLQGMQMPTANGGECTVQDQMCFDSAGLGYELVEGRFQLLDDTEAVASGGAGHPGSVMLIAWLLLWRLSRRSTVT